MFLFSGFFRFSIQILLSVIFCRGSFGHLAKADKKTLGKVLFAVKMEAKRSLSWVALGNTHQQSPKAADSDSVANVLFITQSSQFTTYDRRTIYKSPSQTCFYLLNPHEWSIGTHTNAIIWWLGVSMLQPILGTSATMSTQRRTRLGSTSWVTKEPTGTGTTLSCGRSALILSIASLIVHPTSSGHSVLGVALHPLLSAVELIFFRDTCRISAPHLLKMGVQATQSSRNEANQNYGLQSVSCSSFAMFIAKRTKNNRKLKGAHVLWLTSKM